MVDRDEAVANTEKGRIRSHLAIAGILVVAAALRVWRLGERGYGQEYYAAGVRSMMDSWHSFFFNSFDPAGFVSIDKPPVAFWIQVLSAKLLGFSAFSVLLPQAVEGVATITILYHLVRRRFGTGAGLLASLFLALTPLAVAVDRSNNADTCLVLVLVLAAWAMMRAAERGSPRLLMLSTAAIGVAFNVKMLAAFVVLPAFLFVYLMAAPVPWCRRLLQLTASAVVLAAVSFSWVAAYDLTPRASRPFVDSSKDDSMLELVIDHNGIQRFVPRADWARGNTATAPVNPGGDAAPTARRPDGAIDPARPAAGGRRGFERVPVGPLRLADPRFASQVGWLLPLALVGLVGGIARSSPAAWPLTAPSLELLLWAAWVVSCAVVYSSAGGIFRSYYLLPMAPPLSALAGIGLVTLWRGYEEGGLRRRWLPAALLVTAAWQAYVQYGYLGWRLGDGIGIDRLADWRIALAVLLMIAVALAVVGLVVAERRGPARRPRWLVPAALGVALASLLATPTTWALSSVVGRGGFGFPSADLTALLPRDDGRAQWRMRGIRAGSPDEHKLAAFLEANHHGERYLMATPNTRSAAPIIIETGEAVMAIGGFMGTDPILTPEGLDRLVKDREVRFVMLGNMRGWGRSAADEARQTAIVDWVKTNGTRIDPAFWRLPLSDDASQNPPGDRGDDGRPPWRRGRGMANAELYDMNPSIALVENAP